MAKSRGVEERSEMAVASGKGLMANCNSAGWKMLEKKKGNTN